MSYFILKILIENLFGVENSTTNPEGFFPLSFITFVSFAIIICELRINFSRNVEAIGLGKTKTKTPGHIENICMCLAVMCSCLD